MNTRAFVISLAMLSAAVLIAPRPALALNDKTDICINEIYTLGNAGQDWVELYNPTNDEVSLSGWKVIYNATADDTGNDTVIWQGGGASVIAARGFVVVYSTPNISSSNSYHIKLKNSADTLIDKIKYPTLAGVGTFQSISRTYDASPYIEKNPTPTQGYANAINDSQIKINEIRYDAYGNEFVELYNLSSSSVSLANWTLRNRYAIKTTSPYRYLFQFSVKLDSSSFNSLNASSIDNSLNAFTWADAFGSGGFTKTTDYVALANPDGQVVDRVHWGGGNIYYDGTSASLNVPFDYPAQGNANDPRSIARSADGSDTGNDANDFVILNPSSEGSTNENSFTQSPNTLTYPESNKSVSAAYQISLKLGSNSSAGKGDYLIFTWTGGTQDSKSPHYFRLKDLGFNLTDSVDIQTINYNGSPDINGNFLIHDALYRMILVTDNAYGSAPAITRTEVKLDTVAPAGVYDLAATTAASEGAVDLAWIAVGDDGMSGNAYKYIVKYATFSVGDEAAFSAAVEYQQSLAPQPPSSSETLTVTGLYPAATYYFSVKSSDEPNAFNLSPLSGCATIYVENLTPAAPQGLSADAGLYDKVILSWQANSEIDLAGYNVYRATTAGGAYGKLNSLLITTATYTDENLTFDVTYYYAITAVDNFNFESGYSAEVLAYVKPLVSPVGRIVVNEIMYDPATTEPATEWVELYNKSEFVVNLSSCVFWVPPAYVVIPEPTYLAPGGFFVLARSSEAAGGLVDFIYGGKSVGSIQLKNTSDTIYLTTPDAVLIDSVTYSSSWGAANGSGPENLTLQRKYSDGNSNDFSNWAKSIDQNGTPKAANNTDLVLPNISHTPVFAAYAGRPVTIDASATDNMYWYSGNVRLFYKKSST
ncbi:MAG: lamin tail domain-containing protein, partial [Endomicrobiia bacterium]|nr:lamin tail domain-containing protein [Endomicrobiia bacterium]